MKVKFAVFLCIFCFFFIFCGIAVSESTTPDISGMSVEELLALRNAIDVLLDEKGYKMYFDIERGRKGEEVSILQERLFQLGFYSGRITGKYDSETVKSFKAFEKANGLDNDGLASREDQLILYSESAVAQATPKPQIDTASASKENTAKNVEHDVNFDYEHCMRFPDNHVGEEYKLKGKVEQILGSRSEGFQIRFSVLGNSEEIIYIFVNSDPGYNILESDWLIIDLIMKGTITYQSIWGQEITIPAAYAKSVLLR